ncbi:MAG: SDR family oxidoreductase [Gammaproteobacteria bacterium]|nr:MAG: SDR family oxidoreductase [Gammaproteobacteria bacterium]
MRTESYSPGRRQFLKGLPAIAFTPYAASLTSCSSAERPAGVPVSPFAYRSTAEEVTEGIDLTGKTALVTGCNSGIGYETMRVLALRGAHVYGTGRTIEKAKTACASVTGLTTPLAIELTDFDSITHATNQIKATGAPLDILICNAGIMELPELEQVNGIEKQFYVNHLGHFVLVNQLLVQIVAAAQGRVVSVSSGRATAATPPEGIQFDNLSGEMGYDPALAYGQSKLANALFTLELARRLKHSNATANSLRPGVIATNLGRHLPRWKVVALETVGRIFTKTIEEGAATTCYVATAPVLSNISGYFFDHSNPVRAGGFTEDTEMAKQLWEVSEQLAAGYI